MTLSNSEVILFYTLLAKADVGDLEMITLTINEIMFPAAKRREEKVK